MDKSQEIPVLIEQIAGKLMQAKYLVAFTGAGISVESGIPSFRGEDGLWNRYDPKTLELDYFISHPGESWPVIKEIFYSHFTDARPNAAHRLLAVLEEQGLLKCVITQNIDGLHQKAGSRQVHCFHGDSSSLVCLHCGRTYDASADILRQPVPKCTHCNGLLKPGFIFFGEAIPENALRASFEAAGQCDVMLVIGTTGEVYPAAMLPQEAKSHGALIVEINPQESQFSRTTADIFLPMKAGEASKAIAGKMKVTL